MGEKQLSHHQAQQLCQQGQIQVLPGFRELLSKPLADMWPKSCAAVTQATGHSPGSLCFRAQQGPGGCSAVATAIEVPFTKLSTLCSLDLCRFEVTNRLWFGKYKISKLAFNHLSNLQLLLFNGKKNQRLSLS